MLDLKLVRENPDAVRAGAARKRIAIDLEGLLEADREARRAQKELDELRAEQNRKSKEIGKLPPAERAAAAEGLKDLKARIQEREQVARKLDVDVRARLLRIPQIPAAEVPDGPDESGNVEIRRVGEPTRFDFEPKDHVALLAAHGAVDVERGARLSGSRNYFLKGDAVLLEIAVMRFALDHMMRRGFTPFGVPLLVRREAMEGTAYFPGGEEQAYGAKDDDLFLIGTSEVPLTAYHAGEILEEGDLPRKYVAWSSCFRREAGTYGRDTHGIYRVHQFQKVEQVVVCRADEAESRTFHAGILANSEEILRAFELPYRVLHICTGDLGAAQVEKFDLEAWMPSRDGYGETHSASRFHDYQARRLDLRYRPAEGGPPRFCHTLNNTVVASPRILIALVENHQQRDGSIRIPKALVPYFGKEKIG
ncbi:MAG TPA: serine--tRNA ligase [Planctomycetota bacterium]|nr:serine--tRNA ligase [Planctomycetota bacterium]